MVGIIDVIPQAQATSLGALFDARVQATPNAVAYYEWRRDGEWQALRWRDMADKVARWRAGLAALGLEPGARIAILLPNSSDWVAVDQATLSLGLVTVGLFQNDTATSNAALLEDSQASVLVVQHAQTWREIKSERPLEHIELVVSFDDPNQPTPAHNRYVEEWLPSSGGVIKAELTDTSLAAIVYTSGTTGAPRGAMLSHANLLWSAYACAEAVKIRTPEEMLSFLPLAHAFERVVGYYRSMITGASVAFCGQRRFLHKAMAQVQPTAFVGVPEVYERYHSELFRRLAFKSKLTQRLVKLTMDIGWSVFEHRQGRDRRHMRHLLWPLLRATVASRCLRPLGGRLETAVSGAAALSQPVARSLISLGVNLLQGYGLTEAGPVVSVNRRDDNDPQSAGTLLAGVEIRIGPDNGLWVRSPGVMLGYWRDESGTAEALDPNGWLRTGDKISRLEQKRLYLTGRIKEIIVMTTGEKASPEPLEQLLQHDPLVNRAVVVGEARPYLAAIVNCDHEALAAELQALGLELSAPGSHRSTRLERALLKRFGKLLKDYPRHCQIRRVELITEPWTIENGLVTATGKARRRQVARHFHSRIERLYGRGAGPQKTDFSYNVNVG